MPLKPWQMGFPKKRRYMIEAGGTADPIKEQILQDTATFHKMLVSENYV